MPLEKRLAVSQAGAVLIREAAMSLFRTFSLALLAVAAQTAVAAAQNIGTATAKLSGFEEVLPISTRARGNFEAKIQNDEIRWTLNYRGLPDVSQAHIHFAQEGVNGGIVIFLCSNLSNGPTGTKTCPQPNGNVSGRTRANRVVGGASAQGIAAGELGKVIRAIRAGVAYVNVHSTSFPGGELRGQLVFEREQDPE
jgi:hypothetical protein